MRIRYGRVWSLELNKFNELILSSNTKYEILNKLGLKPVGSNYNSLNERIKFENISTSHLILNYKTKSKRLPIENYLIKGKHLNNSGLVKRLINENILLEVCVECGLKNEWNNKPIRLQLDHIDGDRTNNELSNLRFLCPNCHSQTDTWGAKNIKAIPYKRPPSLCDCGNEKKSSRAKNCRSCASKLQKNKAPNNLRPTKEEILNNVNSIGYMNTGKIYNVSDTTIRDWLRSYGVEPPKRYMFNKISQSYINPIRKNCPEGTSWCSGCKEYVDVVYFSKCKVNPNGLKGMCKKCTSESRKTQPSRQSGYRKEHT